MRVKGVGAPMRVDLRVYKRELRAEMRAIRSAMNQPLKAEKDRLIFQRLIRLPQYRSAGCIVTYVSTSGEVDTRALMKQAWQDGKQVAVPRCVPGTRLMEMYYIKSMNDLEEGMYGILEPKNSCTICKDWKDCLCIVPAFCNDKKGYRLGYGGGYYDRFLNQFTGKTVGINYSECVREEIQHGRYDVPIQMLLTERDRFYFD